MSNTLDPQPSLTLVTLGGAFGMRSVSPFCLKIEMLLKSLQLEFTTDEQPDPRKAPKGKLPYLLADGQTLADSELICQYLNELTQGRVYAGLTKQQCAYGVALSRLAEDHLYWLMISSRWLDDAWWPNVVDGFFHVAPALIRPLIANSARKQVRSTLDLQGLGRHTPEEQRGFAERDLQALQDAVGDEGFLFGDTPNVFDFAITGLMSGIYDNTPATWVTTLAQSYAGLAAYTERVQTHMDLYGRENS